MKYDLIDKGTLQDHFDMPDKVISLLNDNKNNKEGEFYLYLASNPEMRFVLFDEEYPDLPSLYSLLTSLDHWIKDDGEYELVREVNEFVTGMNKDFFGSDEVSYSYKFSIGYGIGVPCTVDDMIEVAKLKDASLKFHKDNEHEIESESKVGHNRCRRKYKMWAKLSRKPQEYMRDLYTERSKGTCAYTRAVE